MTLKGTFAKDNFWIKCFIFIFFSVFGLMLWLSIAFVLKLTQSDLQSLRLSQFVFALAGLAFPAVVSAYLTHKSPSSFLQTNSLPSTSFILLAFFSMLLILPFINFVASWNEQLQLPSTLSALENQFRSMQQMADELTVRMLSGKSIQDLFLNLVFLALVPAVCEELFFRGGLQRLLCEKVNAHLAIWIVAFIFSSYHMQFFGFFSRLLLGALLGYMLLWSKSLYLSMIGHFTNNAIVVIFYFLSARKLISFDIDSIGTSNQWWVSLISFLSVGLLLYTMSRKFSYSKKEIQFK